MLAGENINAELFERHGPAFRARLRWQPIRYGRNRGRAHEALQRLELRTMRRMFSAGPGFSH
jgi:hypothetical protein